MVGTKQRGAARRLRGQEEVQRQARGKRFRTVILPWLFILPVVIIHLLVVIGPSVAALYYSLTDWSGIGSAEFVGLENFRELLFSDRNFRQAFQHNVLWLGFFLTVPVILALAAAALLSSVRRGGMLFRTVLFIPYILPSVVTAFIWRVLLSPRRGIGAQLGVEWLSHPFLGDPRTSLLSIAFVDNWHWWGFLMVLFLSAMQSIPPELYDAARIDGANRWQEFRHVTIPGIRPTLVFMLMMTAIWSFLVFDYIWILTQGGPARSSEVLGTYLYKQAFNRFEAGYAAAIGLTISSLAGVIIGLFTHMRRRGWEV